MKTENMNETNQVCGGTSKSKGGKAVGLALGALGVLGGIAAAVIYKKKKNGNEVEYVEVEDVEYNESDNEE